MDISSIAYQKFYEVLYNHFVSENLSKERQEELGPESNKAWLEKNPETGKLRFHEIFGLYVTDPAHFSRKKGLYDPAKTSFGPMKDPVMIKAFQYLGFEYPDEIDNKKALTIGQKAAILYQLFLEKHYPEFLAENRAELEVYDQDLKKLVKEKNNIQNSDTNDNSAPMVEKQVSGDKDEQAVIDLVTKFYGNISRAKLEDAWNLLAPGFQKRNWKDSLDTFSNGYTNTISIHHVHVFDIVRHSSGMKCKLYYEDDLITRTSIELGNIGKISVADLENFMERVKRLSTAAASAGLEGFEKTELQKFFEPVFSEYVWYKSGMNTESIAEMLPSQETLTIPRLYTVSCMMMENEWFINAINPVKAHSIR